MPDQEVLDLYRDKKRNHDEEHANGNGAQRIPQGITGHVGRKYRGQGEHQAQQGGDIFAKYHNQGAAAALPEPLQNTAPESFLIDFAHASPQGNRFGHDGKRQDTNRNPGMRKGSRVQ